jgi:GT2 family glycosyltransferase
MSSKKRKQERKPLSQPSPSPRLAEPSEGRVDVVIPVFNRLGLLRRCVESAQAYGGARLGKFVFVDDGSNEEGLEAYCRERGAYVRHLRSFGFARAANRGVQLAAGPLFVLMNSDIEATPGWLEPLVEVLETRPEVAIAAPLLLFPKGSRQPERPAGKVQSCGFATAISGRPYHRLITWSPDNPKVQQPRDDLQGATAAVWAVRRSVWDKLRGFEEGYGAYYEDADFCIRAKLAEHRIAYVPRSVLYHWVGASTIAAPKEGGFVSNIQRSEALYFERHRQNLVCDEWALV